MPNIFFAVGRRLAELSPQTKLLAMVGADALVLPLCMLAAVAFRLGTLEGALLTAPTSQASIALLTLPALAATGLYRAVERYIDLRLLVASSVALAAVVLLMFALAMAFQIRVIPRSALLIFWFVAFAYVVTSRFVARALLRRGLRYKDRVRINTAIYGAGQAGVQLAQAMQFSPQYKAVCFLDDKHRLLNKTVAGLHVYPPEALNDALRLLHGRRHDHTGAKGSPGQKIQ